MAASKNFQIVRYKIGKCNFEIMVNPGTVPKFRKDELPIQNVLYTETIFKNQSKAEKASAAELESSFGTADEMECAREICKKGDLQLTAAERAEKVAQKRAAILNYLNKYYMDPKSNLPHPIARLDAALDDIKYRVDPDTPVDKQVAEVMKNITRIIPMRKSEISGTLFIPHQFTGACQGAIIGRYVTVEREKWTGEGCQMQISMIPGDYDGCIKELQRITNGSYQLDIDGAGAVIETEQDKQQGKKGKGGGGKGGGGKGGKGKRK